MPFMLSPGVMVVEKDLTNIVPAVATSIGGFCGEFSWGPCLDPTTVSDETVLLRRFFKPNMYNAQSWFTAANFLSYTNNLLLVRASPKNLRNAVAEVTGSVTAITFDPNDAGSNYDPAQDEVVITEPDIDGGIQAEARFTTNPVTGAVTSFIVTSPGSGYSSAPGVSIVRYPLASGRGFVGQVKLTTGVVDTIKILSGGKGYDSINDVIVISPPSSSHTMYLQLSTNAGINVRDVIKTPTGSATVVSTSIVSKGGVDYNCIVNNQNYINIEEDQVFSVIGKDQISGTVNAVYYETDIATAKASFTTDQNGIIQDVLITSPGSGYVSDPTIQIKPKGYIQAIDVLLAGSNFDPSKDLLYISPPTGTDPYGEKGQQARATYDVNELGEVTSIDVTTGYEGSGYRTIPQAEIKPKGYVVGVNILDGGMGYAVDDELLIGLPTSTFAKLDDNGNIVFSKGVRATAKVTDVDVDGKILEIGVTEEGGGYLSTPVILGVVSTSGDGFRGSVTIKRATGFACSVQIKRGTGFAAQCIMNRSIESITPAPGRAGLGYETGKYTVKIGPPNRDARNQVQATAIFEADIETGAIINIQIQDAGSGYSAVPPVDLIKVQVPGGLGFKGSVDLVRAGVKINNENHYYQYYAAPTGVVGPFAARYPGSIGNSIRVSMADAASYSHWDYRGEFDGAPGTSQWALDRSSLSDELHIVIIDRDGKWTGTKGAIMERYAYVSKSPESRRLDGSINYYRDVINSNSEYIWWMDHPPTVYNWGFVANDILYDSLVEPYTINLTGGTDDHDETEGNLIEGFALFRDAENIDVNLLICGPCGPIASKYVIENVAEYRKDCLAFVSPLNIRTGEIISGPDAAEKLIEFRNATIFNVNSSYGVLDSGYKYQYDRYNDTYRWVPLNGDVAGLCARTDNTNDPWWSPGGLNRGQIKNVVKLAFNPNQTERDNIYKNGINPIVSFPGQGTVLWGDKTLLNKPSAFDRINVRRLFIVLEKAISIAAKYYLFEFNDRFTRAQFKAMVEPYLRNVQARRGIYDFKVVCDETNNTGEVIDRNEFVADIYIKPARSINFIFLNFIAVRTAVSFEEVAGA